MAERLDADGHDGEAEAGGDHPERAAAVAGELQPARAQTGGRRRLAHAVCLARTVDSSAASNPVLPAAAAARVAADCRMMTSRRAM